MGTERTIRSKRGGFVLVAGWVFAILTFVSPPAAMGFPIVEEIGGPQGFARRWEAGMGVGPYSQVNLHTGRVVTALPLLSWSGTGPSVGFALYHNMQSEWSPLIPPIDPQFAMGQKGDASGDGKVDEGDISPFIDIVLNPSPTAQEIAVADLDGNETVDEGDLEGLLETLTVMANLPKWTHSYSANLVVYTNSQGNILRVTLIRDDGTTDVFTKSGSNYNAPPGVFDTLTADGSTSYFLTTKSKWKAHFVAHSSLGSSQRRLDYIQDPSGNRVTCEYHTGASGLLGKLEKVRDATGRVLTLWYDSDTSNLREVVDLTGRHWQLLYVRQEGDPDSFCEEVPVGEPCQGGSGAFVRFLDPETYPIDIDYTVDWSIASITDKDGDAYGFEYNEDGQLWRATDPVPFQSQVQEFTYGVTSGARTTTYTDRRGNDWTAAFAAETWNLIWFEDPLGHLRTLSYDEPGAHMVHEATAFTDALERTWSVDYDSVANVTSSTDPLGNSWSYAYSTDGNNNLLSVTPPGATPGTSNPDKQVQLYYEDGNHPTSVTRVVEPTAEAGGPAAETIVEYYAPDFDPDQGDEGDWNGLVKRVTPPHSGEPVVTEYKYNLHGMPREEWEGPPPTASLGGYPSGVTSTSSFNKVGLMGSACVGCYCGGYGHDGNGNVTSADCISNCASQETGGTPPGLIPEDCWPASGDCCNPPVSPCSVHPKYPGGQPPPSGCALGPIQYSPSGQLLEYSPCVQSDGLSLTRTWRFSYDELGRAVTRSVESNEMTGAKPDESMHEPLIRAWTYTPDWVAGTYEETGPDGTTSLATFDVLGRLETFQRWDDQMLELASAIVVYTDAGEVQTVYYGNGSTTDYVYDDAGRVDLIWHLSGDGLSAHVLDYDWSSDGLVTRITEYDEGGEQAETDFTYDRRNRLTGEERTGVHPYHFTYTYDLAGNRLTKTDVNLQRVTTYTYDVYDPTLYDSQGNRLMYEKTVEGAPPVDKYARWYEYDEAGNVRYVMERVEGDTAGLVPPDTDAQWYTGTSLFYTTGGKVWMARRERWRLYTGGNNNGHVNPGQREFVSAVEYRYDGARERYLVRSRDAEDMVLPDRPDGTLAVEVGTWSDHDGGIYADWTVNPTTNGQGDVTGFVEEERTAHVPGLAQYDYGAPLTQNQHYLHGNLIGTTEAVTDAGTGNGGTLAGRKVFTAFGEPVSSSGLDTRYGYAGAWGYESSLESLDPLTALGWLHVGYRYYDPASGRFVQRDPIGIQGGFNVYVYVLNLPVNGIDPIGRMPAWLANGILAATDWAYPSGWQAEKAIVDGIGTGAAVVSAGVAVVATGGMAATVVAPGSAAAGFCTMPLLTATTNVATATGGAVVYTGHGLLRAGQSNIPPSVTANAIQNGVRTLGNTPGTFAHTVSGELTVITNTFTGNVVTLYPGG